MDAFVIMNLQSTLSLIAFALIAKWYVAPRLTSKDKLDGLAALTWVHVFRYTPLTLLVPGQVSENIPASVSTAIAYGDLASGLLALLAVIALHYRIGIAIPLTWGFSIVGIVDIGVAMSQGIGAELYKYPLGFNWYILNFYVPALIVTHIMIVHRLVKSDDASA